MSPRQRAEHHRCIEQYFKARRRIWLRAAGCAQAKAIAKAQIAKAQAEMMARVQAEQQAIAEKRARAAGEDRARVPATVAQPLRVVARPPQTLSFSGSGSGRLPEYLERRNIEARRVPIAT